MKILLALLLSFSAFASDISVEMNSAKTKLGQIDNDVKTPYLIEFIRNSALQSKLKLGINIIRKKLTVFGMTCSIIEMITHAFQEITETM